MFGLASKDLVLIKFRSAAMYFKISPSEELVCSSTPHLSATSVPTSIKARRNAIKIQNNSHVAIEEINKIDAYDDKKDIHSTDNTAILLFGLAH